MHPIKKALLLLAALPLAGRVHGLVEEAHNCSHTVSLIHARTIASFEGGTDGFTAGAAVAKVEPTDGREFYPAVHEGKGALAVRSLEAPGDAWRTAVRRFAKPLDLRRAPFIEFAVIASPAPVSDMFVRLSLFSRRDSFSCVARIMPTLWRTLTFDCSDCRFLKRVERMEIALCSPTSEVWASGRDFLIDGIRAGLPLDLSFASPLTPPPSAPPAAARSLPAATPSSSASRSPAPPCSPPSSPAASTTSSARPPTAATLCAQ